MLLCSEKKKKKKKKKKEEGINVQMNITAKGRLGWQDLSWFWRNFCAFFINVLVHWNHNFS